MAVGTFTLYAANLNSINPYTLAAGTVNVALVSAAYSPNYAYDGDDTWSDVSATEISGVYGYSTGGKAITSPAATGITGGYKYASANVAWTASGGNISAWRRAVFYYAGTLGGKTNPLIGSFLGDVTPADIPATGNGFTLTLACPADGWFSVTTS